MSGEALSHLPIPSRLRMTTSKIPMPYLATQFASQRIFTISMDGKGRYSDNIFLERLWRTVKYEEVYLKAYANVLRMRLKVLCSRPNAEAYPFGR